MSNELNTKEINQEITKKEFIKTLMTHKKLKFVPGKKKLAAKIQRMNDEDFKELVEGALGQLVSEHTKK